MTTPESTVEAVAIAVSKVIHGDEFDPFAEPEAYDFCCVIAEAAIAALPAATEQEDVLTELQRNSSRASIVNWLGAIREVVREAHWALEDSEDRSHEEPAIHAMPHENAVKLDAALRECEAFAGPEEVWDGPGPLVTRIIDALSAPTDQAKLIAELVERLEFWADRGTTDEVLAGGSGDDEWRFASAERRIAMVGERKRRHDEEILSARAIITRARNGSNHNG